MSPNRPHLFTLTGNLLAERTLTFARWTSGATQRATAESFQVGGKGINVSKMLTRLGAPNTALCFLGGPTGLECETWLRTHGFSLQAFPTSTPTRTGLVVRSVDQPETTFLGVDAAPDSVALLTCANTLDALPAGSVLALSGSLPGWTTPGYDPLRAALHRWLERSPLVVDTYGPPLDWFAREQCTLVRLNRTELLTLFPGSPAADTAALLLRARERFLAQRWVVSDGAAPVWFLDDTGAPHSIPTPAIREVSPTGSGDVMLAAILHAYFHQAMSWREAVAWAVPLAAANAAHPGIAEFPLEINLAMSFAKPLSPRFYS
ncbi:MAG: hypothetical protein FJ399_03495 [Verrucomicrobia bacterium]|nr:hypothetical protein [Verrucomicrobiota bacterium]